MVKLFCHHSEHVHEVILYVQRVTERDVSAGNESKPTDGAVLEREGNSFRLLEFLTLNIASFPWPISQKCGRYGSLAESVRKAPRLWTVCSSLFRCHSSSTHPRREKVFKAGDAQTLGSIALHLFLSFQAVYVVTR